MVFKRRQKATARTEREEEERAAVTAYSGPVCSTHQWRQNTRSENPKLLIDGEGKRKTMCDFPREKWIFYCDHLKAGRRRIGASEEEKDHTEKRGSRVADCPQAAKKLCFFFKKQKRRRFYLTGCTRTCSWHHGLWLNCELKKKVWKLSQEE